MRPNSLRALRIASTALPLGDCNCSRLPEVQLDTIVSAWPARTVSGRVLHLTEPISFWGGVSASDASLTDPLTRHFGQTVANRVLIIRELRGSSSGGSILLELIYTRRAPSAILLAAPDAILALGVLVAREMSWPSPGIFKLVESAQNNIPEEALMSIDAQGIATIN